MQWTKYQILIAVLMVVSGSFNTISVKMMDTTHAMGLISEHQFEHPFIQANFMFVGETLCLSVFGIAYLVLKRKNNGLVDENILTKGSRTFNRFVLWPPALMDLIATTTMYFGLTMTNASSFQMLRGSVIVFVALLSKLFLKRRVGKREWIGIAIIVFGLVLVGLSDVSQATGYEAVVGYAIDESDVGEIFFNMNIAIPLEYSGSSKSDILLGDFYVVLAQVITAIQMVYEEKFISKLNIPALQVVGWEGIFGFGMMTAYLLVSSFMEHDITKTPQDAFAQISNSARLIIAIVILVLSIAVFNYSGVTVTKELTATTRMVLDSVRTFTVWIFAIAVGWQIFHFFQVNFPLRNLSL